MRNHAKLLLGKLLLAALVLAPLGATAQTANLTATLAPLTDLPILGRREPNPGQITPSQTKQYKLTITNAGPSTALGIDVAKPVLDSHIDHIGAVDGCVLKAFACTQGDTSSKCSASTVGKEVIDPNDARSWPCAISSISDVAGSNTAAVTIDVTWPGVKDDPATPDVREDIPTTCPTTITLAQTSVTVTSTGTTTAPATATNTPVAGAQAFLQLTLTSNTASAGPGTQFNVTGSIENLGPCTSVDVYVIDWDGLSDATGKMTWVEGSTTGCLANTQVNWADTNGDGCEIGDIAVGETKDFGASFVVGPMLSDELQRATTVNAQAYSIMAPYGAAVGSFFDGRTLDPDESDNGASVQVVSSQSVGSCSTGGMPGLLGLLLVGMPLLRRRRGR